MTTEAWLFLSLVYLTIYFEYRVHRRTKETIDEMAEATLSNLAEKLVLKSVPSLNKNAVTHIFEWRDSTQEAESN